MIKKISFIILFISIFLISSCSSLYKDPIISVKIIEIKEINIDSIKINLTINVENKNFYDLNIKEIEYDLALNNIKNVAKSKLIKDINLLSNSEYNSISIPIIINNNELKNVLKTFINKTDKANYKLEGKLVYSSFFSKKEMPFLKTGEIDISPYTKNLRRILSGINSIIKGFNIKLPKNLENIFK